MPYTHLVQLYCRILVQQHIGKSNKQMKKSHQTAERYSKQNLGLFQNEIIKLFPVWVINSVRWKCLFTGVDLDKKKRTRQQQTWIDGKGPEPRSENPVLFHQHLVVKKTAHHKRSSVLEAISVKRSGQGRSTESEWNGKTEKGLHLVNNFHESARGRGGLFVLH